MTCARRRQHPAVEARESLRRGQTREMTWKEESDARAMTLRLPLPSRLESGGMVFDRTKGWDLRIGIKPRRSHHPLATARRRKKTPAVLSDTQIPLSPCADEPPVWRHLELPPRRSPLPAAVAFVDDVAVSSSFAGTMPWSVLEASRTDGPPAPPDASPLLGTPAATLCELRNNSANSRRQARVADTPLSVQTSPAINFVMPLVVSADHARPRTSRERDDPAELPPERP